MNPRLLRPRARQAGVPPSLYADLRVGLVAYWPMNEDASSGNVTAIDWTGRGNDLASTNTVASVTGKTGLARQFVGGNSEYLSANSNADLTLGGDAWTLAFWLFVADGAPNDQSILLAKDDPAGREFAFEYNNPEPGELFIIFWDNPATYTNAARTTITPARGQWQFICCTHANNALTVSVTLNSTTTASTQCSSYSTSAQPFTVGKRTYSGFEGFATCSIDELAIWNRALSGAEVATLYNSGTGIDLRQ